jgi:vacuolar-type H+-ATPase subunit H
MEDIVKTEIELKEGQTYAEYLREKAEQVIAKAKADADEAKAKAEADTEQAKADAAKAKADTEQARAKKIFEYCAKPASEGRFDCLLTNEFPALQPEVIEILSKQGIQVIPLSSFAGMFKSTYDYQLLWAPVPEPEAPEEQAPAAEPVPEAVEAEAQKAE